MNMSLSQRINMSHTSLIDSNDYTLRSHLISSLTNWMEEQIKKLIEKFNSVVSIEMINALDKVLSEAPLARLEMKAEKDKLFQHPQFCDNHSLKIIDAIPLRKMQRGIELMYLTLITDCATESDLADKNKMQSIIDNRHAELQKEPQLYNLLLELSYLLQAIHNGCKTVGIDERSTEKLPHYENIENTRLEQYLYHLFTKAYFSPPLKKEKSFANSPFGVSASINSQAKTQDNMSNERMMPSPRNTSSNDIT